MLIFLSNSNVKVYITSPDVTFNLCMPTLYFQLQYYIIIYILTYYLYKDINSCVLLCKIMMAKSKGNIFIAEGCFCQYNNILIKKEWSTHNHTRTNKDTPTWNP